MSRPSALTSLLAVSRALAIFLVLQTIPTQAQISNAAVAPTPPLGWNSWDAYGLTIDEADYRTNTTVLAGIKQYGWLYSVIDEGWYMQNPFADKLETRKYLWDKNGILIPTPNRFPSSVNGAGFKPLADWVHAQGLKFGIHIVRGIPKQVVDQNLPIADSSFHAKDAADIPATCPWDEGNYGVSDTPAGQAYYDSMMKLYAGWGLDYIKVDCISDHPYRPSEIRQIALAIQKTKRPIVLSLSPGPTQLSNAAEVHKYAQMWRISDDHWDVWSHIPNKSATPPESEFPLGTRQAFDRLADWQPYVKPGSWPDEDMLPFGSLTPHPGWGKPRESRLTHDEEQTEFTLWAITRSPLILGANLTKLDDFTRKLITNTDLLDMNQKAWESHPVTQLPAGYENIRVWEASEEAYSNPPEFFAFFNLGEKPATIHVKWSEIGAGVKQDALNLFDGSELKQTEGAELTLPAHGSQIFRVQIKLTPEKK